MNSSHPAVTPARSPAAQCRKPQQVLAEFAARNATTLAGWAGDATTNVLTAVAGVCLTKAGTSIWAFRPTVSQIDPAVTGFWICTVVIPFVYYLKFLAARSKETSNAQTIEAARQRMLARVTAMLSDASLTNDVLHDAYSLALGREYELYGPSEAIELLNGDIRIVLSSLTTLVARLEPPRPGAQFAANVMYFTEIDQQQSVLAPRFRDALLFERSKPLTGQRGILFLDRNLSSSTRVESADRDPQRRDLAFLIPHARGAEAGEAVLPMMPGAAYVFVERKMIVTDPQRLIEQCRDGSHAVPPDAASLMEEYFCSDAGRDIRTILVHPLMREEGRQPRAILNIHSDYDGMLSQPERREQLYYLLRPWTLVLLELLEMREGFEAQLAGGAGMPRQYAESAHRQNAVNSSKVKGYDNNRRGKRRRR